MHPEGQVAVLDQRRNGVTQKEQSLLHSPCMWLFRRASCALVRRARRLRAGIDAWAMTRADDSPRLVSLYYLLLSRQFDREHQAVLAGRHRFETDASNPRETCALLRRSVHRLEKGLLMRPRREIFALDYIDETVACYERIAASVESKGTYGSQERQWAFDVLTHYFDVTAPHPTIDRLRARFLALPAPGISGERRRVPYLRDLSQPPAIRYEDLLHLAQRRRSVRWFEQRPVPRELIEKAMAVATQSPSACNRQPFVFRVFDDPDLVKQVAELPAGTAGFCHNIPCVVVIIGQLRNYVDERDRHVIYIDGSLAAMSFIYALETLGLSSCSINWPDIEERERAMVRALGLEVDERPVMLIAVGYPDPNGLVAYSQKKPLNQICRFNFE